MCPRGLPHESLAWRTPVFPLALLSVPSRLPVDRRARDRAPGARPSSLESFARLRMTIPRFESAYPSGVESIDSLLLLRLGQYLPTLDHQKREHHEPGHCPEDGSAGE